MIATAIALILAACASASQAGRDSTPPNPAAVVPDQPASDSSSEIIQPDATESVPQTTAGQSTATIELHFPRAPDSYSDPTATFAVPRQIPEAALADAELLVAAVVELWIEGPTGPEQVVDDLLTPIPFWLPECPGGAVTQQQVQDQIALINFCITPTTTNDGETGRLLASFHDTLAAAGFEDSALLVDYGRRCFGADDAAAPLACVSDSAIQAFGPGFDCGPEINPAIGSLVAGKGQLNLHSGPDAESSVIATLSEGTEITYYVPDVQPPTTDGNTWVEADLGGAEPTGRCAYIAASFVRTSSGPIDRAPAGIGYALPQIGNWLVHPRSGPAGPTRWQLEGSFATSLSIDVAAGRSIDDVIAEQEAVFDEFDYDINGPWFEDITIAGADRAIRPITIVSGSGDVATGAIHAEVEDYLISITSDLYIEDMSRVPIDEMTAFVNSLVIDRATLLDGLGAAG